MLTTPILSQQVAFDATNAQTVFFNVVGGSQVVSNRLVIKNNTTLATVYDATQVTFKFEHTIPAGTLVNGTNYIMQVQTFDASANASALSNTVQFFCFTAPTIAFTNIPVGNIIENSNYTFEATYDQLEDELLNSYTFKLYGASQSELASSGVIFVGSATPPPTALSYNFAGFDDNGVYYVEVLGQTVNGTSVTTGKVQITVNFVKPNVFAIVELQNNCDAGNITISSNIVVIEGSSNPDPPTYILDEEVDLTTEGTWVKWDTGFSISDNFTIRIWGRSFAQYEDILNIWGTEYAQADNQITLTYMYDTDSAKIYVTLKAKQNGIDPYVVFSNEIDPPLSTEQVFIWVRRINNVYDLIIENLGVV